MTGQSADIWRALNWMIEKQAEKQKGEYAFALFTITNGGVFYNCNILIANLKVHQTLLSSSASHV